MKKSKLCQSSSFQANEPLDDRSWSFLTKGMDCLQQSGDVSVISSPKDCNLIHMGKHVSPFWSGGSTQIHLLGSSSTLYLPTIKAKQSSVLHAHVEVHLLFTRNILFHGS